MSYQHIDNLYKNRDILEFKECYAMEKIHGTSAHITWNDKELSFFPGGVDYDSFKRLFDQEDLKKRFEYLGHPYITVYGEAYGGKIQGMKKTYGNQARFVAFEVRIGSSWLAVLQAEEVVKVLDLDFVPYNRIKTDLDIIDAERDAPSIQAVKNGINEVRKREGIVLRPLFEVIKNNGERVIAKHKALEFQETRTPRNLDSNKLEVLKQAQAITDEWVTEMRLAHVLDQFPNPTIQDTGNVISLMLDDIKREASGEIVISPEVNKHIARKTALMFKQRLSISLYEQVHV